MIFDSQIQEAIRIGEKMVSVATLQPACEVFPSVKKKIQIRSTKRRRRYRRPNIVQRNDKLHKMADWYRPKESDETEPPEPR